MTARAPSFRAQLAARIAAVLAALAVLGSGFGYLALRSTLYERLDAVLLRLASIEAAATSDSPDESVHFHDEVFAGPSGGHDSVLVQYAEFWTVGGDPVLHTANLGARHLPLPAAVRTRVAATERPELFSVLLDGERYRSVLYPLGLMGPQHQAHLLQVAVSARDTEATLRRVGALLAVLVVTGFAVGGGVGWWIAGYAVRPVLEIIGDAEAMDATRSGNRIAVDARTLELRRLVAVLNALLLRIDAVIEGQRQFLADAGHAIKTPITVLRGNVDVALRKDRTSDDYRRVLAQSLSGLKEVSALAEDLITLARSDGTAAGVRRDVILIGSLLNGVKQRFDPAAGQAGISIAVQAPSDLAVETDAALLERAVSNLVDNAVKYAGSAACITLEARRAGFDAVEVVVSDTGRGIPAVDHTRLFDRFYRGESGRAGPSGSGLGLAIVRASVESCGGRVTLRSEPGHGTSVAIMCVMPPGGASSS